MPNPTPGSKLTMIPQDIVARAAGMLRSFFGGRAAGAPPGAAGEQARTPWFGPGQPQAPQAPPQDVAGRRLDYQNQYNINLKRRTQDEGVSFELLRRLANFDMVRICIETRKDQMAGLTGSVMPRMDPNSELRPDPDERCQKLMDFFQYPDKRNTWDSWVRQIVGEQLEIDAVSLYVRRTNGGDVYAIEQVNGETITPKLDITGRTPMPPEIAYQQINHGMAAIDYTSDELLYVPRNMRVNRYYGMSPVEQVILTVNVAIRREVQQLNHFMEGNIPEALISVPKEWSPEQVNSFQQMWDALMRAPENRDGKIKFVPGGMVFQPTRTDATLFGQFDEWLMRIICYAFSLPSLPFVQQLNRATAETADEAALQEGLLPMMIWFKGLLDRIIQNVFGYKDLEWVWDDVESIDTKDQSALDLADIRAGLRSIDEVRAERGLPPLGVPPIVFGLGPMGFMSVASIAKACQSGLDLTGPTPPAQPGMPGQPGIPGQSPQGMPGDPSQGIGYQGEQTPAAPEELDQALAGVPPELLAAVGLGPAGRAGRTVDVTDQDEYESDPARGSVPHPMVLRTLRAAQRRAPNRRASR